MSAPPSRPTIWLYVLAVTGVAGVTIALLYGVFIAGLVDGMEGFLADPPGTLQDNPVGIVAVLGIFLSVFALIAVVVVGGAQYIDPDPDGER